MPKHLNVLDRPGVRTHLKRINGLRPTKAERKLQDEIDYLFAAHPIAHVPFLSDEERRLQARHGERVRRRRRAQTGRCWLLADELPADMRELRPTSGAVRTDSNGNLDYERLT